MFRDIIGKFNGSNETSSASAPSTEVPTPATRADQAASPTPRAEGLRVLPKSAMTSSTSKSDTLESGVEIKGTLKSSHDLFFDGRIEGEIHSDGILTVGENACVKGGIKTRAVVILGKVEGDIAVQERCELKDKANVYGDITAGSLAIEEGASFMGQSRTGKASIAAAPLTRLAA